MSKALIIDYYTDILCVWAWVSQTRVNELNNHFGEQIEIRHHCIDVYGNAKEKIENHWESRGGYEALAKHTQKTCEAFSDVTINPKVWSEVRPATSANAHSVIKAVEISHGELASKEAALQFRKAFFLDALDICNLDVLFDLIKAQGLDSYLVKDAINNGKAMAALMKDYQNAKLKNITGSPSYVIDNGRQTLYGNVGYRVIRANIEELLIPHEGDASWC